MPVKRRYSKARDLVISERAVELFSAMRRLARRCTCQFQGEGADRCQACDEWWNLQADLCLELSQPPWIWPCIRSTRDACSEHRIQGVSRSWPSQLEIWDALVAGAKSAQQQQQRASSDMAPPSAVNAFSRNVGS
jgi:hypothetical protein